MRTFIVTFLSLSLLILSGACSHSENVTIDPSLLAAFKPLPDSLDSETNPPNPDKILLGRTLYFENRISKGEDVSCNSCHNLETFGVDNKKTSEGHLKQLGGRNSPTVLNAAGHFVQFWDGRAKDVEEQAKGPILNPVEMSMASDAEVVKKLTSIPGYKEMFAKAFNDKGANPISWDRIGLAIGAFERKLITPSRWDRFLKGDQEALSSEEKKGFQKFMETGCQTCHNGAFIGGSMYQKAGLVKPWPNQKDGGRFEVTKQEADRMIFKVPSLRNVEKTAPYFHDGGTSNLEDAIGMMAEHQLGRTLSSEDKKLIATFLKSTTGEVPAEYVAKPQLP